MNEFITDTDNSELGNNTVPAKITTAPARITAADCQRMSNQELLQMFLKAWPITSQLWVLRLRQ